MEIRDLLADLKRKLDTRFGRIILLYGALHLRNLDAILDKPILHSLVLSNDGQIQQLGDGITAVPVAWFLGSKS